MSREIKFRAWLRSTNKFIYTDDWKDLGLWGWHSFLNTLGRERGYTADLQRYIGLNDKNDKDVYEGDIVKCSKGCYHEIYFEPEYAGTFGGGLPAFCLRGLNTGYAWIGCEEIIGNIYENPELT